MPTKITSPPRLRKKTQPQTITALQRSQLVAELAKLGDPVVAAQQASSIIAAVRALHLRSSGGYDIGKEAGGFYARPREADVRPARELRALAALARKAVAGKIDFKDWIDAWAALPSRTSARLSIRQYICEEGSRSTDPKKIFGYSAPGIEMIIPKPQYALAAIEAAIAGMKKTRKPDLDEAAVIRAVQKAYQTLTGRPGGRVTDHDGLYGPLHQLGLAVDHIFGIKCFPRKDSSRIKNTLATKNRASR